tara:strand:+ start:146 stop:757 length:612 start_codon:yes stop_codon:yes gene_type:complete
MGTQFWLENPNELVRTIDIWPTNEMTNIEKYNAITRLMLILTTIGFIATKSIQLIIITIIFMGCVVYLYHVDNTKKVVDGFDTEESFKEIQNNVDKPTVNNPYSNVMINSEVDKKVAPPAYNCEVKEEINKNVVEQITQSNDTNKDISKIFKDDSDKKEFEGSLRAFYSTANTEIPNDQAGFTDFCYGNLDKTKEVVAENNKI